MTSIYQVLFLTRRDHCMGPPLCSYRSHTSDRRQAYQCKEGLIALSELHTSNIARCKRLLKICGLVGLHPVLTG